MEDTTRDHQQEARALRTPPSAADLPDASLADVLVWGLVGHSGADPVKGIIDGSVLYLDVLRGYVTSGAFEPDVLLNALHDLTARLDAASEVQSRLRRAAEQGAP